VTKPEPEVAVVILNYNGRRWLPSCLSSLTRLTTPAELIVADNGSTDGSLELLCQDHPSVRVIQLGRNLGFAAGYNRALAEVERPWLALLNNDATLEADWLERLLAYAQAHPRVAILGGKLLFAGVSGPVVQSAGASFTDAGTAYEIGWGQPDTGQYQAGGAVGAIPGAAMLIRRAAWLELGGFDPAYYAYLEDVDLCWRAWLGGHEVAYVPEAVAHHAYGASGGGRLSPLRIRWMQRNRMANMVKHLEAGSLVGAVGVSLAYDAYRLVEYARRGQWPALRALAAGTAAFGRALPGLQAQRRAVQQARQMRDAELRARGLMVPALTAFREYRRLARASRPAAISPSE
jgi:GT2 family glycosyltransferase